VTSPDATVNAVVVACTTAIPAALVSTGSTVTAAVVTVATVVDPPQGHIRALIGPGNLTTAAATTGTTLTIAKPTNLADGDLLVAFVYNQVSGGTVTPPSGWSLLSADTAASPRTTGVYGKVVTSAAGEPATYQWGFSTTARNIGCVFRVLGANNAAPLDVAGTAAGAYTAGNATAAAISAANAYDLVMCATYTNDSSDLSSVTFTQPSGYTDIFQGKTPAGANTSAIDLSVLLQPASGSTGAVVVSRSPSPVTGNAWLLALAQAPVSTAPVVAVVTTIPAPMVSTGETVTVAVVAASTSIPTPVVTTSGNATATPTVVAVVTTVPAPTMQTGSTVVAAVVATSVTVKRQTDFLVIVADMQPGAGANPPPTVVAAKVVADNPDYVLMPGDLANDGTTAQYGFFDTMYGSIKSKIYPVPGNHDWVPGTLANYNTYWGSQGGTGNTPPNCYSFDTATGWHVIGIDSDQANVGSVNNPSATYTFVANDLAANTGKPIIAFWHHPRWSEGTNAADPGGTGDSVVTQDIWNLLVDYQCDLVFVGHCHSIQRFPKMGKTGAALGVGIREFVVGTGGSGLFTLKASGRRTEFDSYQAAAYDQLNSQFFGYLRLWLTADNYRWQFVSQNAGMLDTGGPVITNVSTTSPTPAVVSAVATVPGPVVSVGVTVTAAVVAASVSIPAPVASGGAVAAPTVVAATITVPAPVVSAQQNAAVTASVVATAVSIPTPSVSAGGSVNIAATVVSAVTLIPAVVVSTGTKVTAGLVVAVTTIPGPTAGAGVTVFAAVVTATTMIPLPTVPQPGVNVAAVVVDCRASIPAPTVQPRSITLTRISLEGGRLTTIVVPAPDTATLE